MPPRDIRNDLVDAVVLEVHGMVHDQGWLADRALERVLRREQRLYSTERRAAAEAAYGLTRWQGLLDWLLAGQKRDLTTRYAAWLTRFGGVRLQDAARRVGVAPSALAGVEHADERIAAIADPVERLSVAESLPSWIAERFASELGLAEAQALAHCMNERAPLTVRTNLIKTTREDLRARLDHEGTRSEPTQLSPWGLQLDGHANAFALASFQAGHFEIQDEGSQLVALACAARPGQLVIDACAGAGGKSLALAMEMHNKGSLVALDSDADRLNEAKRRARRAQVHNLRTRPIPAGPEAAAQLDDLAGKADLILIDAPCSGLGTLRRKPDARWRLRPEDPARFAAIQGELAVRFARLVAPGGRLIYATCAIGHTENQDVAAKIPEQTGLSPFPLASLLGAELAGRLGVGGPYTSGTEPNQLQLLPHRHQTDGFFLAAFERAR
jgi:16S rRNA (cytosine967-C5)-methyltransferase